MGDPVTFQSFPIPQAWIWGGNTFWLALFSGVTWTDQNAGIHLGAPSIDDIVNQPSQLCPGIVNGRVGTVQDFIVEPTILSVDDINARVSGVLFDENFIYAYTLFQSWRIPNQNPLTWRNFTIYNHTRRRVLGDHYYNADQVDNRIANIRTISAEDLARLPTANGTANLAFDGNYSQVVVPTAKVTATSLIHPYSLDSNINGIPFAPRAEYVAGVSFVIRSTIGGDVGLVGWEISEPF